MKPTKGLSRNQKTLDQAAGIITYGKNGVKEIDVQQNERGFSVSSARIPYAVCGVIETDSNPLVFSTNNINSAIGFYNEETDTYQAVLDDATLGFKLGFNLNSPIKGVARRNYKNEIEAAWIETVGSNPPRFINTVTKGNDLKDFTLFPEYKTPNLVLKSGGGSLPMATYFAAVRYLNSDGSETRYTTVSTPISLRTEGFKEPGSSTDKGLIAELSGLDLSYSKIQIAIIKRVGGVTTARELEPITMTGESMTIPITTLFGTDISLEEVLIPPAFYIQARSITQLNDLLYMADMEEAEELNMQRIANKVTVTVESKIQQLINQNTTTDGRLIRGTQYTSASEIIDGSYRTFKHGEVVALYLVFHLTSGQKSKGYHIPGRVAPVQGTDMVQVDGKSFERFQVEDTISDVVIKDSYTTHFKPGIWVNQDEQYPDHPDYALDNLTGRVRHHKMPSTGTMSKIYRKSLPSSMRYGINCMDYLGIQVGNVIIPEELKSKIAGWEIHYAKRTYENSLVSGQGCVTFPSTKGTMRELYTTGGNFNSTVGAKSLGTFNEANITLKLRTNQYMRIHSPDLVINRPSINPNIVKFNYSLRTIPSTLFRGDATFAIACDYTDSSAGSTSKTTYADNTDAQLNFNRLIGRSSHIPNMGIVDIMNNLKGEPTFIAKLEAENINIPIKFDYIKNYNDNNYSQHAPAFEETYVVDLLSVKRNLYGPFTQQDLIRIGTIEPTNATKSAFRYGGDTFIGIDSYFSHGIVSSIETNKESDIGDSHMNRIDPNDGTKVARLYLVESSINLAQRYKDPALPTSAFYPETSAPDFFKLMDRTVDNNMYAYDKSASSLADLIQGIKPHSIDEVQVPKSPFRIIRSMKQSREGKKNNWKQFSALDYYEAQKDMGQIMNLQGYGDRLIIHHNNALFITRDKTTLQGDILSVTLGSGDIFQFPPIEGRVSKLGYAGTQHRLGAVLTDAGYVFPDAETGELFIMTDKGLNDISGELSRFFKDHLRLTADNPFQGDGVSVGYDRRYDRLLLTKKEGATSFTLSIDPRDGQFRYFHDYFADYYMHTRKHTYIIKNELASKTATIYRMNDGPYGLYFDRTAPKPFFLDIVFNGGKTMILNSLNWVTQVTHREASDLYDVELPDKTITAITIWNNYQCTGKILLDKNALSILNRNNRHTERVWNFNDFRNLAKQDGTAFLDTLFNDFKILPGTIHEDLPWYEKGLMEGQYFVVRLEFDNKENKHITLHDVDLSVSASQSN